MIIDKKLLEMAKVYRMPTDRIIKYIYIPEMGKVVLNPIARPCMVR